MNNLIIYLGYFYIVIGGIFLFVPIIYLQLGRSKDLLKGFLNLLIGIILIIKNKEIDESFFVIFLLITVINVFYLFELFLFRWNQLTDKEKKKLVTFMEFKNNLSKIYEALKLVLSNLAKPLDLFNFSSGNQNKSTKKWVRNNKNDNIKA